MAITIEEVTQLIINVVREKEELQVYSKRLEAKVQELQTELDSVRLSDKPKDIGGSTGKE